MQTEIPDALHEASYRFDLGAFVARICNKLSFTKTRIDDFFLLQRTHLSAVPISRNSVSCFNLTILSNTDVCL